MERAWIENNLKTDKQYNNRLMEYYERAIDDIYDKIDVEFSKIADVHNNGIGISGAYKAVSQFDIEKYEREAKVLVEKANQLRKQGKKVTYSDFSDEENARMKVYNATMRLNRLEYLKSQIGLTMVDLGLNVDNSMRQKISDDYMQEVKRQAGILGEDLTSKSLWTSSEVAKIIMAQTGSVNFSQRVWADNDALKAELDAVISTGIIRGDNPREMAKLLKEHVKSTVDNHRYVTERIARTESARVQFKAQKDSLTEMGYCFCQWHAEPSACKICLDTAKHKTKWGSGIYEVDNVPSIPAHPNCRCAISAYWVDDDDNSSNQRVLKKAVLNKSIDESNFGKGDFTKPSIKQQFILDKVTPKLVSEIVDYINDIDFDDKKMTKFDFKAMRASLNKAKHLGFDKKPMVVHDNFDKINSNAKIYRYTDRKDQLIIGDLEYSGYMKSFHGRGIYFGNENSNISGYKRNENYDLIKATLMDDTILIDENQLNSKIKNIEKENPKRYEVNAYDDRYYSLVAMEAGADGLIITDTVFGHKLGYVVLFNRGKLVIFDD